MKCQAQPFEHGNGDEEGRVGFLCAKCCLFHWRLRVFGNRGCSDTMACARHVRRLFLSTFGQEGEARFLALSLLPGRLRAVLL